MNFLTHSLLPLSEVRDFQKRLSAPNLPWRDGRLTAGEQAALVKNNHQLDPNAELTIAIGNCIATALTTDPLVKSFSLVRKAHSLLVLGLVLEILMDGMLIILSPVMVVGICLSPAFLVMKTPTRVDP